MSKQGLRNDAEVRLAFDQTTRSCAPAMLVASMLKGYSNSGRVISRLKLIGLKRTIIVVVVGAMAVVVWDLLR